MVKKLCILLILVLICSMFSGCYDRREIDDLGYVLAIGFDKGSTNFLRLTLQFAVPEGGGGGEKGDKGGGTDSKSGLITTLETPSLYSGLNMTNAFISKQVTMSHAKALVFSKELAESGKMHQYLHAMIRGREFRPNMYVVISRGTAEEYIRSIKPALVLNSAKYYELSYRAYQYTGFSANTQLQNFYLQMESLARQPVAILAGVNKFETSKDMNLNNSTYKEKGRDYPHEGDFKAGDATEVSDQKSEVMGLAVFNGEKMVGELDGEEATYHLMCTGEYINSYTTFPDPQAKGMFVVLNMKKSRNPVHKIEFIEGKPKITLKILLEADFLSIQSGINYEDVKNLHIMEETAEKILKDGILRYLNKTSKEFKSDICGFGEDVKGKFLTWKEWKEFKWLKKYENSSFNVDVDVKIRRPGLIIRSLPAQGSEGEVR